MEIEFYGTYLKKPYFRAVSLIHKPSARSTLLRIIFFLGFTAAYIAMIISSFQTAASSKVSLLIGYLITFTVVGSFTFQPYIKAFTQARKDWSNPITRLPIQGVVSEKGVIFNPGAKQQVITWDSFKNSELTNDYCALVAEDETVVLLQRSFFQSDEEWQTLQRWVGQHIKMDT
jgi:hypothetical protein